MNYLAGFPRTANPGAVWPRTVLPWDPIVGLDQATAAAPVITDNTISSANFGTVVEHTGTGYRANLTVSGNTASPMTLQSDVMIVGFGDGHATSSPFANGQEHNISMPAVSSIGFGVYGWW